MSTFIGETSWDSETNCRKVESEAGLPDMMYAFPLMARIDFRAMALGMAADAQAFLTKTAARARGLVVAGGVDLILSRMEDPNDWGGASPAAALGGAHGEGATGRPRVPK